MRAAVELKDAPVVILAKTVKGWTLGGAIEGRNVTHQAKKLSEEELKKFRDTLELPIRDEDLAEGRPPYYHPGKDSEEVKYIMEQRTEARRIRSFAEAADVTSIELPKPELYDEFKAGSKGQPWPPRWLSFACCGS